MKLPQRLLLLSSLFLGSCSTLQDHVPGSGDLRQAASVHIGQRIFDHSSANCLDEQDNFGFEYTVDREDGDFGYEFGIFHHSDSGNIAATGKTDVDGLELTGGIRRTFPIEGTEILPYAGIGLDLFRYDRDNELGVSREGIDVGIGAYIRFGATMKIDTNAFIGIDVRFIEEDWLGSKGYNLDGDVVSVVLGFSF